MNKNFNPNGFIEKSNIMVNLKEKNVSLINTKNHLMNKTLEGLKKLETNIKKKKNKIFITKCTRASSTGFNSDYSSRRYNEIQTLDKGPLFLRFSNNNNNQFESINTDRMVDNFKSTVKNNLKIKIKDLKRQIHRQKSSNSRNFKKHLNNSSIREKDKNQSNNLKSTRNSLVNLDKDLERPKTTKVKIKLTFTRNQCIPMLIHPEKKYSDKFSILNILNLNKKSSTKNFNEDTRSLDDYLINKSLLTQERKSFIEDLSRKRSSIKRLRDFNLSVDSDNSEEKDVLPLKKEAPNKEQLVIRNFLRSKANKLNMNIEKDNFFSTKTNLINYFEEVYKVPYFKNKLCFKNDDNSEKDEGNNEANINSYDYDKDYHKYQMKLEKLKVHNNMDSISTFFLNTWKRKFQEKKDIEIKMLNMEEAENKVLEDEKGKINKSLLINEHIFLEYLQYKYDRHCDKINFADVNSRTKIFIKDNGSRIDKSNRIFKIKSRSSENQAMSFDDVILNHIKHDHFKHYKNPNSSCDELKRIVEKIKEKNKFLI